MMPIQYMTPTGVWACSCEAEKDKPAPDLIEAPADADGFHGMDGLCWDGKGWVEYTPPPDSCTALQGRLALGQTFCEQVTLMLPNMDWSARQAWEYATTWHRKSPLLVDLAKAFNMSPEQVDGLFRLAVTLDV